MELAPAIFTAKVMHKRTLPRVNQFTYRVYYLACPLHQLQDMADGWRFGVNRPGILGFDESTHGARNRHTPLQEWAHQVLADYGLESTVKNVVLVAMPKVLGYVFNPVSFWLCVDADAQLRAVICEVNNTFGESHSYLCAHADHRPIHGDDWLQAEKLFHVSPFLPREGHYRFRFAYQPEKLGIWIDYYNAEGHLQLLTALTGKLLPYTRSNRRKAFWMHPLVTIKTIGLIHWQAIKLLLKKIRYIPKPAQKTTRLSTSHKLKKK